ncbi:MAG: ribosome-associated translation inhibitor RaiA [Candidatus Paceibacterota bacterium]
MALNTNLKTTNIEAGDDLQDYLAKKLIKLEQFIDEDDTTAHADIELEKRAGQQTGQIYRAEINLQITGSYLRSEEDADDIRDAIAAMQESIIRKLRKVKEKRQSRIRSGARKMKQMIQGWYGRKGDK